MTLEADARSTRPPSAPGGAQPRVPAQPLAEAQDVPVEEPTCRVSGCSKPGGGILTVANRGGGFRVSACDEHGWRATQGERFVFDVMGRNYVFGGEKPPPHYSPHRADPGVGSLRRSRRRQRAAALPFYDRLS